MSDSRAVGTLEQLDVSRAVEHALLRRPHLRDAYGSSRARLLLAFDVLRFRFAFDVCDFARGHSCGTLTGRFARV